ncbi:hypothetical protein D9619_005174 [Psilocybe cf. subviscida]|uniref:Uncharacterized protein n=1 Tax=Psilocybe cf. subviscida TaxID=2480587 RepID=A0A8H5FBP0_9AGAR|nr:hypothetical protein D9619_005174 [Psilocybe cf. subviscida]
MHRIKTLHAHIGLMTNKVAADSALSVIFDQPAPVLGLFGLDFDTGHKQDPPRTIQHALRDGKALFARHSPILHIFSNNPNLILNPVHNLRLIGWRWGDIQVRPDVPSGSVKLPYLEYLYKDDSYSDHRLAEIQQAIEIPILRICIEKKKPRKLLFRLYPFWFCDFSFDSRTADVEVMFRDSSRKDFAIRVGRQWVDPSDFLDLVMDEDFDFSSVEEWRIADVRCSKETIAALKDFFSDILRTDQVLIFDKRLSGTRFSQRTALSR